MIIREVGVGVGVAVGVGVGVGVGVRDIQKSFYEDYDDIENYESI